MQSEKIRLMAHSGRAISHHGGHFAMSVQSSTRARTGFAKRRTSASVCEWGPRSAKHRAQSRLLQLADRVVLVDGHLPAVVVPARDIIEIGTVHGRARKARADPTDAALCTGGDEQHPPHAVLHAGEVGVRVDQREAGAARRFFARPYDVRERGALARQARHRGLWRVKEQLPVSRVCRAPARAARPGRRRARRRCGRALAHSRPAASGCTRARSAGAGWAPVPMRRARVCAERRRISGKARATVSGFGRRPRPASASPALFVANFPTPQDATTTGSDPQWPTTCFVRSTPRIR